MAFIYSIARVLLGVKIALVPLQAEYACPNAAGNDIPDVRQEFRTALNSGGSFISSSAAAERADISLLSVPNTRKSIFLRELSRAIAPDAKNSALDVAYTNGSSKTMSAPQSIAAAARACLGAIAISPRCVKPPLSTTTIQSAQVMRLASFIIYS